MEVPATAFEHMNKVAQEAAKEERLRRERKVPSSGHSGLRPTAWHRRISPESTAAAPSFRVQVDQTCLTVEEITTTEDGGSMANHIERILK